jgi:type II secretory pathway pseudopilin PulG
MMRRITNWKSQAFTLVELLIAISITLIIVVLLSRVFIVAANLWQNSDQRTDAFRDARSALQMIARDLSRADSNADAQMLTLSNNDPAGNYAQEAFAVTPIPNSGKSDLCVVGYYLVWDDTAKAFTLKRLLKDSDNVINDLRGATVNFASLYAKPTTPADKALYEEDLAAYAWDLEFRPGILADPEAPIVGPSTKWHWLEIRFKAMSPTAARKLRNLGVVQGTWSDPTSTIYRNAILPYEQQFVTRVTLRQTQ